MRTDTTPIPAQLTVVTWPDPVIDALGFPFDHPYSELTGSDHESESGQSVTAGSHEVSSPARSASPSRKQDVGVGDEAVVSKITVRALVDPVVEQHGFPVGSPYVEGLWLGILGPSATWALRRLGATVTARPEGVPVDLAQFGASLGLGGGVGRNSSTVRTIKRLVSFGVARWQGNDLLVRRAVAPLTARQLARLSPPLVRLHHHLVDSRRARSDQQA